MRLFVTRGRISVKFDTNRPYARPSHPCDPSNRPPCTPTCAPQTDARGALPPGSRWSSHAESQTAAQRLKPTSPITSHFTHYSRTDSEVILRRAKKRGVVGGTTPEKKMKRFSLTLIGHPPQIPPAFFPRFHLTPTNPSTSSAGSKTRPPTYDPCKSRV